MTKEKLELLVVSGALAGHRFQVAVKGSRLGRSSSCEIAIADPALSRYHCLFEFIGGELRLTDLASANGTLVNGAALSSRSMALKPDDIITVGDNTIAVIALVEQRPLPVKKS